MPDKPHRFGTKLFMLCDAASSCCFMGAVAPTVFLPKSTCCLSRHLFDNLCSCCRFEIYLGKVQHDVQRPAEDNKMDPAAVVRNMEKALTQEGKDDGWRVVTIDHFYTSVALLLQLLTMKVFAVGTIMTNLVGFCTGVVDKSGR